VGLRSDLDAVEKRKISCLCGEFNPGRLAISLVTIPTELSCHLIYIYERGKLLNVRVVSVFHDYGGMTRRNESSSVSF
jgi:hypothetical protein